MGDNALTENIGAFADAAQHHGLGLLHGLAQKAEHGVQWATDHLPEGNAIRDYVRDTVASDDAAMAAREAAYQARTGETPGSYAGAVAGNLGGVMTGVGALRAAGALPTATTALGKLGALAAEGATIGAATPITDNFDQFGKQAALQMGVGALSGPLLYGIGKSVSMLGRGAGYMLRPEATANRKFAEAIGVDDLGAAARQLRSAPEYVPGEQPSAASILANPRAVQAERVLRNDPAAGPAFQDLDTANNAARLGVVQRLAGTDADLQAAIAVRRSQADAFRSANLPESGAKSVDPAPVVKMLKNLTMSANPIIKGAAREHLQVIRDNADKAGKVSPYMLDDLKQTVGTMLAKHAPNGAVGTVE